MCTAVAFENKDFYFGRNFDLEYSYDEKITVTARNYPFPFRHTKTLFHHYALIGMAYIVDGYPLYYEATNEAGLSMAALNFPKDAAYKPIEDQMDNIAPFELIPWILTQCSSVSEVRQKTARLNLISLPFNDELPLAPLHWMVSGRDGSLTIESVRDGLHVYDNPVGILTNSPCFDYQMTNLDNYMNLSTDPPVNRFCSKINLEAYSRGMGAIGLPGDLSSTSRFVKAAFTKLNSCCGTSEAENISQFFHILRSVEQQRGCVRMADGQYEVTLYSCCCNADKGIYYYTTYENSRITGVNMWHENLDCSVLISYPLLKKQQVFMQN